MCREESQQIARLAGRNALAALCHASILTRSVSDMHVQSLSRTLIKSGKQLCTSGAKGGRGRPKRTRRNGLLIPNSLCDGGQRTACIRMPYHRERDIGDANGSSHPCRSQSCTRYNELSCNLFIGVQSAGPLKRTVHSGHHGGCPGRERSGGGGDMRLSPADLHHVGAQRGCTVQGPSVNTHTGRGVNFGPYRNAAQNVLSMTHG